MDKIEIYIPTKPITENHARFRNRRKKPETHKYEAFINTFLQYNKQHCKLFGQEFDKKKHFIEARYYFCNATERFFTKGGWISSLSIDIDNSIKILQDRIFDFIGINDKAICKSTNYKIPFQINAMVVELEIKKLDKVEEMLPDYIKKNLLKFVH